ncbi:MAG TPA: protein kinase [Bryobacteraceae bacterium]|nr:protein kinase [Bryobacteraceae bacterium]
MEPTSPPPGAVRSVNSYQIIDKLGAGGMGVVYKALDTKLNRTVALKFLPAEIEADEKNRAQFLREARAASGMDHPNVGTIHAIEETADGVSFIVMAYYDGETLAQRIKRGSLPPAQAISIAVQMARGLAEAHSHNIIHRDIKSSNAIFTRQGVVKIVDFGLARAIQSASATLSTEISGSAAYMSPEQALGKPLDQRTDLWSLGVVLYEMLTGRLPFQGDTMPGMLMAVVNSPPTPLEDVPAELQEIVYHALAKDPARRYQSASEMLADLEKLETGVDRAHTRTLAKSELKQYVESAAQSAFPLPVSAHATKRRWLVAVLLVPVLAAMLLLILVTRQRIVATLFGPTEKHIAVLPFSVIGSSAGSDVLADGLMESLTGRLSNLELGNQSLWVVPASEVRRRKVADASAAQKEFGATLVVTGTVERTGSDIRLVVNLIDAKRMRQLGSEEVEDRTGDFAMLQNSAIAKLARLMNVTVPSDMLRSTGGAASPAAYELYLKALGLLRRYDKPGNLDQALGAFEDAVKTDPRFALAYAGLGEAYLVRYRTDQNPRWIDQASAACERAVQIDDQLAPVYVTLGRIHNETGKTDLASQEFQHALQLDPRSADALLGLASVYEAQARLKDAEQTLVRAVALRPDYWDNLSKLGLFYYRQRRFEEAAVQLRKVVELTPDNSIAWLNLAAALRASGKLVEATSALQKSIQISPSYPAHTNLGNVYYQQHRYADSAQQYEKAMAFNAKDYRVWINLANADTWLDKTNDALAAFRRALPLLEDAVKLHPQDPTIQSSLGIVYAKLQEPSQAIAHLETAVALAPTDGAVLARMAEAYESLGDRPKALGWISKAIANGQTIDDLRDDPGVRKILDDPNFQAPKN